MRWAYGVMSVYNRRLTTLPRTLESLGAAGFDNPRLFVDGYHDSSIYLPYQATCHHPPLRPFGNWITALWELLIREPTAHRYAIFQDDVIAYKNLRQYLEAWYPSQGYLNLFTFMENESLIQGKETGWYESGIGKYASSKQAGRGALGLVFNREAAMSVLSSPDIVMKPVNSDHGHRKIDGAVVTAMNAVGFMEYVHNPTLLQHIGEDSSIGNNWNPKTETGILGTARSWRGEWFDSLSLLKKV